MPVPGRNNATTASATTASTTGVAGQRPPQRRATARRERSVSVDRDQRVFSRGHSRPTAPSRASRPQCHRPWCTRPARTGRRAARRRRHPGDSTHAQGHARRTPHARLASRLRPSRGERRSTIAPSRCAPTAPPECTPPRRRPPSTALTRTTRRRRRLRRRSARRSWSTAAQNAKILAASEMRPEVVAAGADGDFDAGAPQGVVRGDPACVIRLF